MKKFFKYFAIALIGLVFVGTFVYLYRKSRPKEARYEVLTPAVKTIERSTVIAGKIVPRDEVNRFGVIDGTDLGDGVWKISRMVEKPPVEEAPTNLAIFGRYLLSPAVMHGLGSAKPGVGGEIQLTDTLDEVLAKEDMYALVIDPDEGFDTGTPLSWLESNVRIALRDPKLGPALAKSLPALLEKLDA